MIHTDLRLSLGFCSVRPDLHWLNSWLISLCDVITAKKTNRQDEWNAHFKKVRKSITENANWPKYWQSDAFKGLYEIITTMGLKIQSIIALLVIMLFFDEHRYEDSDSVKNGK